MLILAFETSGPTASVALMRDGALIGEHTIHHTRTHSETVLPSAERLMRELGFDPSMLGALAVNIGPGSFTGVRIGVATANAMASALRIPVIGIDSLSTLYENARIYNGAVCPCIDARNAQGYMAVYENGKLTAGPYAGDVAQFAKEAPRNALFMGDGAIAYRELIQNAAQEPVFAPKLTALARAASLCQIAHERLMQGDKEHFECVEPLYLRPSQAERVWEQRYGQSRAQ